MDAHATSCSAIADRMHNDVETERKVVRNELAKINRVAAGAHAGTRRRLPELVSRSDLSRAWHLRPQNAQAPKRPQATTTAMIVSATAGSDP